MVNPCHASRLEALGVRGAVASDGRNADPSERTRCRALHEARLGRGSDNSPTWSECVPNPMDWGKFGDILKLIYELLVDDQ